MPQSDSRKKIKKIRERAGCGSCSGKGGVPCLPLPSTAFHCLLLPSTAFYCLPLASTGFYWLLLASTGFYWLPLPSTAFHCLPLPSTAFHWLLFACETVVNSHTIGFNGSRGRSLELTFVSLFVAVLQYILTITIYYYIIITLIRYNILTSFLYII